VARVVESFLLGQVWPAGSCWRAVHLLCAALLTVSDDRSQVSLPAWVGGPTRARSTRGWCRRPGRLDPIRSCNCPGITYP
jgi:hypothetical protein